MKYLLIFLFISQFAFSQTDSLSYYYKKGELNKAIKYGENQLKIKTNEDTNYAVLLNNLAGICSTAERFDLAEKYYLKTRILLIKYFGDKDITVANNYNNIGNMYFTDKKYEKAKDSFVKSLEILTKIEKYDNEIYCKYLRDAALAYFNLNDFDKAEEAFLIVYKLQKANLKPQSITDHSNIINLIASINKQKNKLDTAEKYYKESVDVLFLNFGETNTSYQKALFSLGFFYESIKNNEKATEYFLKSFFLQKKYLNENTVKRYISDVEFLRSYFLTTEQYNICESFFIENINLNKIIFGNNTSEHINALLETSVLYVKLDNQNAIIKYSTEAFNILDDNKLQKTLKYYDANKNLASSYTFIGEYDKAAKHYNIILNTFDGRNIVDELKYNEVKLWLADIYFKKGDFGNCEKLYLELHNDSKIVNSESNFKLLVGLVDLYLQLRNYDKAAFYYEKLINYYSKKYFNQNKNESEDYFFNNSSFKFYFETRQFEKAEIFAKLNVELVESDEIFKNNIHILTTNKRQLSLVYKQLGDFEKWKKIVLENYEAQKKNANKSNVDDVDIYLDLANVYSYENNYSMVKTSLDKCIDIFENKLGTTNNLFENVYLHYIAMCIDSNISNEEVIRKLNLRIKEDINNFISYQSADDLSKSIHIKDRTRHMSLNYIS